MPVYEIEHLTKIYKGRSTPANDELSFTVEQGEIFGLLGDNGAGKTTLVRQMVNLLTPTSGTIRLFGKPLNDSAMYTPLQIGYMPQSSNALNMLTVAETFYFAAHLRGLSRPDAQRERDRLIELLRLGDSRDMVVPRLSGGQKRMVLLGTTLAAMRPVLILDEPTNDLSPQNRRLVWELLRRINQEQGTTIILVTHNAIEAEKIIQRVGIMSRGQMIALGQPGRLKGELNEQLRLEVIFAPDAPPAFPQTPHKIAPGPWQLLIDRTDAPTYLDIINRTPSIEDFQLSTATLEDLYLHLAENGG